MPLIEFDRKVYLPAVGEYRRGERYDLAADVAERCVANEDARYVNESDRPQPKPEPTHPFSVAANEALKQSTDSISAELREAHGVAEEPTVETTTPQVIEPENAGGTRPDDPAEPPSAPPPDDSVCNTCNRKFGSVAARKAHQRQKKH